MEILDPLNPHGPSRSLSSAVLKAVTDLPRDIQLRIINKLGIDQRRALGIRPGRIAVPPGLEEKICEPKSHLIHGRVQDGRAWCFHYSIYLDYDGTSRPVYSEYTAEANKIVSSTRWAQFQPRCVQCMAADCRHSGSVRWTAVHRRAVPGRSDLYSFTFPCEDLLSACNSCKLAAYSYSMALLTHGVHAGSFGMRAIGSELLGEDLAREQTALFHIDTFAGP